MSLIAFEAYPDCDFDNFSYIYLEYDESLFYSILNHLDGVWKECHTQEIIDNRAYVVNFSQRSMRGKRREFFYDCHENIFSFESEELNIGLRDRIQKLELHFHGTEFWFAGHHQGVYYQTASMFKTTIDSISNQKKNLQLTLV